jgi:hypothetical protein
MLFGMWLDGMKAGFGKKLEELSGKPLEEWYPTVEEAQQVFGGQPDRFTFIPYLVGQDENFVGKQSWDSKKLVYTGNLTLPAEAQKGGSFGGEKAEALDKFIASCPKPPVYIGWGSVSTCTPKWMTLMAVRSLKLADCPGVVLGGWSGLKAEYLEGEEDTNELKAFCSGNVFFIESAAHEVLFPKCSVIVHHGGVGTTTVGVKSGRPNVITPIFYDQFDSAKLVAKCGQGVAMGHLPTLKPEDIAKDIKICLTDPEKIKTAAELGAKMKARDGLKETTDEIIKFIRGPLKNGSYWKSMNELGASKKKTPEDPKVQVASGCASCC